MEGLSQSQTNHLRHLKAFVSSQVQVLEVLSHWPHRYCIQGWVLCPGTHGHAGAQQRAWEVRFWTIQYFSFHSIKLTHASFKWNHSRVWSSSSATHWQSQWSSKRPASQWLYCCHSSGWDQITIRLIKNFSIVSVSRIRWLA